MDVLSMVIQSRYQHNYKQCNRKNIGSYIIFVTTYIMKMVFKYYCEYVDVSDCDSNVAIYKNLAI